MIRVALLTLLLAAGCQCRKSELAFQPPADSVLLPIPDRQWAEGAPDEGWCGETSIQMAALHYGAWVPQPVINSLGRPTHVDLWEEDVPTALEQLGLSYERSHAASRDEFVGWIITQVRLGHPVIVGAKIFPTDHPDWDVDHLMPIVGFSPRGLVFNTNLEPGQEEVPWAALGGPQGISFAGPTGKFYGYAVSGLGTGPRVTLRVLEESPEAVKLEVQVSAREGLLQRDDLDGGLSTEPLTTTVETVSPRQAARFTVIPAP